MGPLLTSFRSNIFALDSGQLIKFDLDLNPLDTIILPNSLKFYSLYSTSNDLYARSYPYLYKLTDFSNPTPFLNIIKQNIKMFDTNSYYIHYLKVIDDKLCCFNPFSESNRYPYFHYYQIIDSNEAILKGTIDISEEKTSGFFTRRLRDIIKIDNSLFIVSDKNLLANYNIKTKKTEIVSNLYELNATGDYIPIREDDSTSFYQVSNKFFKINMNTMDWTRLQTDNIINSNINNKIWFRKFDYESDKLLYLIEDNNADKKFILYESDDFGSSFKKHVLSNINLAQLNSVIDITNTNNNCYITITNKNNINLSSEIIEYDKNYNYNNSSIDSNFKYKKVRYLDDSNIVRVVSSANNIDINEIDVTTDGGETWTKIKEYGFSQPDTIEFDDGSNYIITNPNYLKTYDIVIDGVPYWVNAIYIKDELIFRYELLNLENLESKIILKKKVAPEDGITLAYDNYNNSTTLVINDSMFLFNSILDAKHCKSFKLPDNGRITNERLKRFGNRYYASYYDGNHSLNLYWIVISDDGLNSVESLENNEPIPYFYNSSPFPQPTKNLVTIKIYIENEFQVNKKNIKIYNVNGVEIEKEENINVNPSSFSTVITWDASDQLSGIYFLVVDLGITTKTIKIIKN